MKFKSKTLIIDNDEDTNYKPKIRPCTYNYARMTVKEMMYYKIFIQKIIQNVYIDNLNDLIQNGKEFLLDLWCVFINIVQIPILPIIIYIISKREIKNAQKDILQDKCCSCVNYKQKDNVFCDGCKLIDGIPSDFEEIK